MFKLDDNLLIELGLGTLPAAEKNRMLGHIYETLEMRVGMKLAQKMTNEQLDEFEAFIDRNDEAGALKWLESNFPDYKQVVANELEALKVEIKTAAPQIVASSQQHAQAAMAAGGAPAPSQPSQPVPQYAQPQLQQRPQQYAPAPGFAPQAAPVSPSNFPASPQQPIQPVTPQTAPQYVQPQPYPTNPMTTTPQFAPAPPMPGQPGPAPAYPASPSVPPTPPTQTDY